VAGVSLNLSAHSQKIARVAKRDMATRWDRACHNLFRLLETSHRPARERGVVVKFAQTPARGPRPDNNTARDLDHHDFVLAPDTHYACRVSRQTGIELVYRLTMSLADHFLHSSPNPCAFLIQINHKSTYFATATFIL
jgi:hypothetical protein